MRKYLKRVFKFNASHSNVDSALEVHSHTFIVSMYIDYKGEAIEENLNHVMTEFLDGFKNQNLNELAFFKGRYPSIEEIGDRFYEVLKIKLQQIGIELYELGVADGPMVTYLVSDRLVLPNRNDNISGKNYEMLTKMIERI